jgi:hypothetical protein
VCRPCRPAYFRLRPCEQEQDTVEPGHCAQPLSSFLAADDDSDAFPWTPINEVLALTRHREDDFISMVRFTRDSACWSASAHPCSTPAPVESPFCRRSANPSSAQATGEAASGNGDDGGLGCSGSELHFKPSFATGVDDKVSVTSRHAVAEPSRAAHPVAGSRPGRPVQRSPAPPPLSSHALLSFNLLDTQHSS